MNDRIRHSAVWLAAALCIAGCERAPQSASSTPHPLPDPPRSVDCPAGRSGGRLRLTLPAAPRTFNPVFALDSASDQLSRLLFGALVQFDFAAQEPRPGLAESWSVSADGRVWTFKLRRRLHWSDGRPLTAADVVFTWAEVIYNPRVRAPLAPLFRAGGRAFKVSAPDAHTVVVATPEVFAPFLEFFGSIAVLPRHVLGGATRQGDFAEAYNPLTRPDRLVAAGPFRLKEHRPGQWLLLERNPGYWAVDKAGQRLPYFDEVELVVATNAAHGLERFLAGHSDVCERLRPEDLPRVEAAVAAGRCRLLELGPGTQRDLLWFNQNTNVNRISGQPFVPPYKLAWFRHTAFRQAISCALDRDRIVREVHGGHAVPCVAYLGPEAGKWYNPNTPRFGFDRARARALLAKVGLEDRNGDGVVEDAEGHPCDITLLTNTGNPIRERLARCLAEDLGLVGVRVKVELMPFAALERLVNETFTYEAVLLGLSGGAAEPASHLNVLLSREPLHQWFPQQTQPATDWEARLDQLMEAQMRLLDFAQRKQAFDEVQVILAEQLPMIYTVTPRVYAAAAPGLSNVRPSVLSPLPLTWNIEELCFQAR